LSLSNSLEFGLCALIKSQNGNRELQKKLNDNWPSEQTTINRRATSANKLGKGATVNLIK